jgi:hypothetical protein
VDTVLRVSAGLLVVNILPLTAGTDLAVEEQTVTLHAANIRAPARQETPILELSAAQQPKCSLKAPPKRGSIGRLPPRQIPE